MECLFNFCQDSIKYTLIGDSVAQTFFFVNPTTGEIAIRLSLTNTTVTSFSVYVVLDINIYIIYLFILVNIHLVNGTFSV